MKYSTVEIRPSRIKKNAWEVNFSDLDGDRVNEGHYPHGLGFYHYPRRIGKEKAFDTLRVFLMQKHEEEINNLTKSLAKLGALKFPKSK